jgi:hypothetical protein
VQLELNFYPPVIVENLLPFPFKTYVINQHRTHSEVTVVEGESVPLYYVDPNKTVSVSFLESFFIITFIFPLR